jgi:hypothetical protein
MPLFDGMLRTYSATHCKGRTHLWKLDKQLILHESAMCADDDDEEAFQDISKHLFQHEQSLDPSRQTQEIIDKNGGFIPFP